jgi:hypothetical protein
VATTQWDPRPGSVSERESPIDFMYSQEDEMRTGNEEKMPSGGEPVATRRGSGGEGEGGSPVVAELAVVLVTTLGARTLRRTVRHLREQTIRDRIELVLVGPTEAALAELTTDDLAEFAAVRRVAVGPITNVDRSAAPGIRAATAPVVAIVEDHAYPEPAWAEAIVSAHRGPWAVVGPAVNNANPATGLSWTSHLLAYYNVMDPAPSGETRRVSRHNVTFKRAVLEPHFDRLEELLGRGGGLLPLLAAEGHRFYLEGRARIAHANPSRLPSLVELHLHAGRVSAASRSSLEGWSPAKRFAYVLGSPLFPLLRLRHMLPKLRAPENSHLLPRIAPALALGLVLDAVGQAIGFAAGPGRSEPRLDSFEYERLRHTNAADRELLSR